jgi:hypothetical protein
MRAGPGFHGKLSNVDVSSDASIDHFTIDKSPRLQAVALQSVLQAAQLKSCRTDEPAVAKRKDAPERKDGPSKSASPAGLRPGYAG